MFDLRLQRLLEFTPLDLILENVAAIDATQTMMEHGKEEEDVDMTNGDLCAAVGSRQMPLGKQS